MRYYWYWQLRHFWWNVAPFTKTKANNSEHIQYLNLGIYITRKCLNLGPPNRHNYKRPKKYHRYVCQNKISEQQKNGNFKHVWNYPLVLDFSKKKVCPMYNSIWMVISKTCTLHIGVFTLASPNQPLIPTSSLRPPNPPGKQRWCLQERRKSRWRNVLTICLTDLGDSLSFIRVEGMLINVTLIVLVLIDFLIWWMRFPRVITAP